MFSPCTPLALFIIPRYHAEYFAVTDGEARALPSTRKEGLVPP